jgi:GT2 family glycosyltransferase
MNENTGSYGGFYVGVKRGYERGYDWWWLMDDDTIPTETALENLINKNIALDPNKIGFLCSKVLWTDQSPHFMNIPGIKPLINSIPFNIYDEKDLLLVESASFVSLLIKRNAIKTIGLPIKEFFIWGDDVEYTLRITKNGFLGFYVKDSITIHKTKTNYPSANVDNWRYYYIIRNWLIILKKYDKKRYIYNLVKNLAKTIVLPPSLWFINLKACIASIFFRNYHSK